LEEDEESSFEQTKRSSEPCIIEIENKQNKDITEVEDKVRERLLKD